MGIHVNKFLKWTMGDVDAAICFSHAFKDNFTLRVLNEPKYLLNDSQR